MRQETITDRVHSLDDIDTVVDVDAHVYEPLDRLVSYIDDRHAGARQLLEGAPSKAFTTAKPAPTTVSAYNDTDETADGAQKLTELRDFDIDHAILNPTRLNAVDTINNPRLALALSEAYNSWIAEKFVDDYEELKASIVIAPQKPDLAAEEIDRRADEGGFVSIALPSALLPPAGHERYDPIYEAAQDHDLPIIMHGVSSSLPYIMPTLARWTEAHPESIFYAHPFKLIWHLMTLVFRGIPERFPNLEFVFQEAGVGYVPYVKWRLDDTYLENSELVAPEKRPSKYIDDGFYFSTQPLGHTGENPEHLAWAIEMAGPDSIMYSSDLPHPTFDPPEELFNRIQPHFNRDVVDDMMGGTARRVFNL